nr:haloacid dehalogenase-like hydrolase [Myxococcus sp. MH1]
MRGVAWMLMGCSLVLASGCASSHRAATDSAARGHADVAASSKDPLPSWTEGPTKAALLDFVERVTREGGPDFVPASERIAVFDNDGTLWSEQPLVAELAFVIDRVKALAPQHPEWRTRQPFQGVLEGDVESVKASGKRGLMELFAATHAGMTTEQFERTVSDWLVTARHPTLHRPYTDLVYQPMLELLALLRARGFKTFVVSGGDVGFMRPWMERVYGVPREQVVGSRVKLRYQDSGGAPSVLRLAELDLLDDGAGKPVGIEQGVGRRPLAAFGNSDGDFEMLEWTTSGPGPRLGLLVHHTDAEREWAYDREARVGKLARGLDEAPGRGWLVVDMRRDWKVVHPFERATPR